MGRPLPYHFTDWVLFLALTLILLAVAASTVGIGAELTHWHVMLAGAVLHAWFRHASGLGERAAFRP